MSKYTKKVRKSIAFEDDEVVFEFRRMKRKDFVALAPLIQELQQAQEKGEPITDISLRLMDQAADKLPDYVISLTGLRDAEGDEIGLETVMEDSYFVMLVSEFLQVMFDASGMGDDKGKGSGQPSPGS